MYSKMFTCYPYGELHSENPNKVCRQTFYLFIIFFYSHALFSAVPLTEPGTIITHVITPCNNMYESPHPSIAYIIIIIIVLSVASASLFLALPWLVASSLYIKYNIYDIILVYTHYGYTRREKFWNDIEEPFRIFVPQIGNNHLFFLFFFRRD